MKAKRARERCSLTRTKYGNSTRLSLVTGPGMWQAFVPANVCQACMDCAHPARSDMSSPRSSFSPVLRRQWPPVRLPHHPPGVGQVCSRTAWRGQRLPRKPKTVRPPIAVVPLVGLALDHPSNYNTPWRHSAPLGRGGGGGGHLKGTPMAPMRNSAPAVSALHCPPPQKKMSSRSLGGA